MGKCSANHQEVEESTRVVKDGAKLVCSYAQSQYVKRENWPVEYLRIPCGHGIMESGHLCAHDQTCVPLENLSYFPECVSPEYEQVLLDVEPTDSQKALFESGKARLAEKKYDRYKVNVKLPCLLLPLDRWMNADEKATVEKYLDIEETLDLDQLKEDIMDCKKTILDDRRSLKNPKIRSNAIALSNGINTEFKNINQYCNKAYLYSWDFGYPTDELDLIKTSITNIKHNLDDFGDIFSFGREACDALIGRLEGKAKTVSDLIAELNQMEANPTRLITMDSYLICKCGGIISIVEDGSEFQEYCDGILQIILDLIDRFIEDCEWKIENKAIRSDADLEPKSYEKAVRVLQTFRTMLDNAGEEVELEDGIILELISHSYNAEVQKHVCVFATVLVGMSGSTGLTVLYGAVQAAASALQGDFASATANEIAVTDQMAPGFLSPSVVTANNWYSNLTTLLDAFYRSDETWIEDIKITVFSNNSEEGDNTHYGDYAHLGRCKMDKEQRLVAGSDAFSLQVRNEYVQTADWQTTAIAQVLYKEHKGEEVSSVINNEEGIKDVMQPEKR